MFLNYFYAQFGFFFGIAEIVSTNIHRKYKIEKKIADNLFVKRKTHKEQKSHAHHVMI